MKSTTVISESRLPAAGVLRVTENPKPSSNGVLSFEANIMLEKVLPMTSSLSMIRGEEYRLRSES